MAEGGMNPQEHCSLGISLSPGLGPAAGSCLGTGSERPDPRSHGRPDDAFDDRTESEVFDRGANARLSQAAMMQHSRRRSIAVRDSSQLQRRSREKKTAALSVKNKTPHKPHTLAGEPAEKPMQKDSTTDHTQHMYHWSVMAGALLIGQTGLDCLSHQFEYIPDLSELCGTLLLLYPLALVLAAHCLPRARLCTPYLVALGSVLLTCQIMWYWDRHASRFKHDILARHEATLPVLCDMPSHPSRQPFYYSLYGMAVGCSTLSLLDAAVFLLAVLHNCAQSWFLSYLGVQVTAVASVIQWVIIAGWPLVSPGLHPSWVLRIVVPGVWTALLIHCSWAFGSVLKRQQAAAQELESREHADGILTHMLKNTMADAMGCVDTARNKKEDRDRLLQKASDILFRGMWWCKLRLAMVSIAAGRYVAVCSIVEMGKFTEDLLRGREVVPKHRCRAGIYPDRVHHALHHREVGKWGKMGEDGEIWGRKKGARC